MHRTVLMTLLLASLAGCFGSSKVIDQNPANEGPVVDENVTLGLVPFADGFTQPVLMVDAGPSGGGLHVVEQPGTIRRVSEEGQSGLWLDISDVVGDDASEKGLLGLAFPPDYPDGDPRFYVSYTEPGSTFRSVLARYEVDAVTLRPDRSSAEILLAIDQPFSNHNGGHILFGPDGYLYYGMGDGGLANDPGNNGQNPATLLGTLMRLDVAGDTGYSIPEDNPFEGAEGRQEVWAYGLRNPWRFAFDRQTGDLFIGDVGQNAWEEINHQPADSTGGENYGWNVYEGTHDFRPGVTLEDPVFPVAEYANPEDGCSVTGGYAYRGIELTPLVGVYVFGDFCSGTIWGLRAPESDGAWTMDILLETEVPISSFAEDADGAVYVIDYRGAVLRLGRG